MTSAPTAAHVPPQNIEAEESVLGAMLVAERSIDPVILDVRLRDEDFYRERHRTVFRAIVGLHNDNEPVDVLTVAEALTQHGELEGAGGRDFITTLASTVPAAGNARHYAQIVKANAQLRRLLAVGQTIQQSVQERAGDASALIEDAERALFKVAHEERAGDFSHISEILAEELHKLEALAKGDTAITGTPSGFRDLDNLTGGFQRGNLIVIAARPAMGKSAFVANIAEHVAVVHGKPVAFFSLEMAETELAQRFIACQARIPGDRLRKGRVKQKDWQGVLRACNQLDSAPLWIDDSSDLNLIELRAKARRLHAQEAPRGGLGLIMVDYLQLMRPDEGAQSRVEQVGQFSRGLKILSRELNVPVIAVSQLSRAPEQRHPPRPILSDLRECVTGDTLVVLADGRRIPVHELVGLTPEVVAASDDGTLMHARADKVWRVGRRPVLSLRLATGRVLRATESHRLLTGSGWKTLGSLRPGERIALARELPEPAGAVCWPDARVALLGQLIGDGSYLSGQPMRYTTSSEDNSRLVAEAAVSEFGAVVKRYPGRRRWHQLLISGNGTRWAPAGINQWLRELGVFGQRSHEKRVPREVFRLADRQIALLLRHLWATDGAIWSRSAARTDIMVYYGTSSPELAQDVAALLLRLGIVARISTTQKRGYRPSHQVVVSGKESQERFLERVRAFGPRVAQAEALTRVLACLRPNTNVDTVPVEIFARVRSAMREAGISQRRMAALRGTSYGGTSHFRFAPSRAMLAEYAAILDDPEIEAAAASDLFWDRVTGVDAAGEEDVYDLTVPGPASWLADGIVSHNSGQIEQDSDLVAFIYRDEYYNREESEKQGLADIIIAKHRNGPVGTVELAFIEHYPMFRDPARDERPVEQLPGEGPPLFEEPPAGEAAAGGN